MAKNRLIKQKENMKDQSDDLELDIIDTVQESIAITPNLILELKVVTDNLFLCVINNAIYKIEHGEYSVLYESKKDIRNLELKNNNLYFIEDFNMVKRLELTTLNVEVLLWPLN